MALCAGALLAGVLLAVRAAESAPPAAAKRFARAAARAMEGCLAEEKPPYRLGLLDVNEDGTPELVVLKEVKIDKHLAVLVDFLVGHQGLEP